MKLKLKSEQAALFVVDATTPPTTVHVSCQTTNN